MADTPHPKPTLENRAALEKTADLTSEDFYLDGPFMVFTAAYHLKRGFCCDSGCRHCPYR